MMRKKKQHKLNTAWFGVVVGILAPILGFFISYFVKANSFMDLEQFINVFQNAPGHRTDILTLCLVMNMFAFYFIFFLAKWYEASKGLVVMTLILAAYVVYEIVGI